MAEPTTRPRAWIVYESMYGSTGAIAVALSEGLDEQYDTRLYEVGEAPDVVPDDVELLMVGGPTHAFTMSTPQSRASAAEVQHEPVLSSRRGVREWLADVQLEGSPKAVAFDTRLSRPRWFWGSAARAIHGRLAERGARLLAQPQSFYIAFSGGQAGALCPGELGRARDFGRSVHERRPVSASLRPPRALRSVGYAVLAAVNLALLGAINLLPDRALVSFVTDDVVEVLGWVNLSLAASAGANLVYVFFDRQPFKAGAELAQSMVGLMATIAVLRVFPFDFAEQAAFWPWIVRGVLWAGIVGSATGMVSNLADLVASLAGSGGHSGRLSPR